MIPEITIYLARFWGSLFMILGGLSVCGGFLGRIIKFTDNKIITITTGYITFLLGLITIVLHNLWVWDWRVAITILGWTTLFKGLEKIILPERVNRKAQMFKKLQWFWGLIIFLMGTWFFWMSLI